MEDCVCGIPRKQFWLWRDSKGDLHASHFQPGVGLERSVVAATARDALIPLSGHGIPHHQVRDAEDPSVQWQGRCSVASA